MADFSISAKLVNVLKGDVADSVNIRRIGGTDSQGREVTSSDPELVSGKRYLVYLAKLPLAFEADTQDSYSVLEYFEISESNTVDTRGQIGRGGRKNKQYILCGEEAAKINSIYSAEK